ncbi:hypothetical protein CPB86DRAFT_180952 [Serendipita vermifera]|nr:hypothetical protein CPB86DRAFT_180952 [Serendipita vermifera]
MTCRWIGSRPCHRETPFEANRDFAPRYLLMDSAVSPFLLEDAKTPGVTFVFSLILPDSTPAMLATYSYAFLSLPPSLAFLCSVLFLLMNAHLFITPLQCSRLCASPKYLLYLSTAFLAGRNGLLSHARRQALLRLFHRMCPLNSGLESHL